MPQPVSSVFQREPVNPSSLDASLCRATREAEHTFCVATQIADRRIDLGHGDSHEGRTLLYEAAIDGGLGKAKESAGLNLGEHGTIRTGMEVLSHLLDRKLVVWELSALNDYGY